MTVRSKNIKFSRFSNPSSPYFVFDFGWFLGTASIKLMTTYWAGYWWVTNRIESLHYILALIGVIFHISQHYWIIKNG